MWPFSRRKTRPTITVAARPHPSRLLRSHSRRKPSQQQEFSSIPKMVILVRTDLNLSVGKIATYAAHAAVSLFHLACARPNACNRWLSTGQRKYVLKVGSEAEMDTIAGRARGLKLPVVGVRTPEAKNRGAVGRGKDGVLVNREEAPKTAVAIMGPSSVLKKLTGHLQRM